jgi:hypothetical protein
MTKKLYNKFCDRSAVSPMLNNKVAPNNPTSTPINWCLLTGILNTIMPIRMVKRGVREFNMPVRLLLIWVSAFVNKKAGNKFPNTPIRINPFQLLLKFSLEYCFTRKGHNTIKAMPIRKAATSSLSNALRPSFIKTKELPHTSDKAIKISHESVVGFIMQSKQTNAGGRTLKEFFAGKPKILIFVADNASKKDKTRQEIFPKREGLKFYSKR